MVAKDFSSRVLEADVALPAEGIEKMTLSLGGQTVESFSLHEVHAVILGDKEIELLVWMSDGANLILVVDEVSALANYELISDYSRQCELTRASQGPLGSGNPQAPPIHEDETFVEQGGTSASRIYLDQDQG